jgi:hypothetical protein
MSPPPSPNPPTSGPEVVDPDEVADHLPSTDGDDAPREAVAQPAKVMRVGSMVRQLLDEVRTTELDAASRQHLEEIYRRSVDELAEALSPDLHEELDRLATPFQGRADGADPPSESELRIAHAQLIGWLEGLFHGIQATLFAQQVAARQQLDQMRSGLPPGREESPAENRPGTYL